ncbi:hypothetical protein FHR22_001880 [Sphingopyxis panaciterrae]|uniref:hypothetical protein n=1 Tax=Sphingopyxis panaciterrae TaxID=363841 RepID=UPI0014216E57|nr:hypothetical protein [Sphingopyxis panaciterrae]NIJ37196.1 hypothetical protein [Sphingopyxis panaciterrae]
MQQNWQAGDFSTLNEGKYEWKAFGVSFDLADIQSMLAPYQPNSGSPTTVTDTAPSDAARRLRPPADDEIRDKMLELHRQGIARDQAAKLIATLPGFEGVGNEHARRVVQGYLPRGRPKKQAGK